MKNDILCKIFTDNMDDQSTLDLGGTLPQPSTNRFTPLRKPVEQFASPKPNVSILTPVREPGGLLAKRNNSHLTPLVDRHRSVDPDSSSQKTKPITTPTAVINEVNDMVKGFFNNTNSTSVIYLIYAIYIQILVFHKEDTAFQDDTPLRTRTLNIFSEESPIESDPTLGLKRFSIFRRDSECSSLAPSPHVTTKNSVDDAKNGTLDLCGSLETSEPFGRKNTADDENGNSLKILDNHRNYSNFFSIIPYYVALYMIFRSESYSRV